VVVDDSDLQHVARLDAEAASDLGGDHDLAFGKRSNSLHGDGSLLPC